MTDFEAARDEFYRLDALILSERLDRFSDAPSKAGYYHAARKIAEGKLTFKKEGNAARTLASDNEMTRRNLKQIFGIDSSETTRDIPYAGARRPRNMI